VSRKPGLGKKRADFAQNDTVWWLLKKKKGARERAPCCWIMTLWLREVGQRRVLFFDESDLSSPRPAFDLFFSGNCRADISETFKMNQSMDAVAFLESGKQPGRMLGNPAFDVVGDADVEGAGTTG
jgi:hypothetical protein